MTNNDRELWEKERELDKKFYPLDAVARRRLDEWLFGVLAAIVAGSIFVSWLFVVHSLYQRLSHPPAAVEAIR